MKLAILSDIHGNLPALQAVAVDISVWQPDMVVVNGDVVNGGPQSVACWAFVQQRQQEDDWIVVGGNHEDYVAAWGQPGFSLSGPAFELARPSYWTYGQFDDRVTALVNLPQDWSVTMPDGTRVLAMHATLLGARSGLYPHTPDDVARQQVDLSATVFATAHTHVPHQRQLDGTAVVNTGAVGLSGDGDGRAAYGRLHWDAAQGWDIAIARVPYDRAAAEQAYFDSGYLDEVGPLAAMTLVELRLARDVKTRWSRVYREQILAGKVDIEQAVTRFLDNETFRPWIEGIPLLVGQKTPAH